MNIAKRLYTGNSQVSCKCNSQRRIEMVIAAHVLCAFKTCTRKYIMTDLCMGASMHTIAFFIFRDFNLESIATRNAKLDAHNPHNTLHPLKRNLNDPQISSQNELYALKCAQKSDAFYSRLVRWLHEQVGKWITFQSIYWNVLVRMFYHLSAIWGTRWMIAECVLLYLIICLPSNI